MKKSPKTTIIVGKDHKDIGVSIELLGKIGKDAVFLKGVSLDAFGGRRRAGLGVSKDIIKNKYVEVDTGIFVTQDIHDLLEKNFDPKLSIGLSGRWRF